MERKWINWLLVALAGMLILSLGACGETKETEPDVGSGATGLVDTFEDALTIKNQLLLGTLWLEDTAQAISGEQTKELLTLWQAYAALTASGTAATEETEAVQNQIIEAMTSEQVAAIAAMGLTNATLQEFYVEVGLSEEKTPEPGVTPESTKMSDLSKEDRQATRTASGEEIGAGGGSGKSAALMDMVIELLESQPPPRTGA